MTYIVIYLKGKIVAGIFLMIIGAYFAGQCAISDMKDHGYAV